MHTRLVGGMWMLAGRSDSRTWSGLRNPRAVFTARICTPPMTDAPATSLLKMWQSRSRTTSEPGCVWLHTERRLPCVPRSEEHTSELQSHHDLVCRLLLEKKKKKTNKNKKTKTKNTI